MLNSFFCPEIFGILEKILMLKTFGHFGYFYLFRADCKKMKKKKVAAHHSRCSLSHERTTLEALLKGRGYLNPLKSRGQTNLLIASPNLKNLKIIILKDNISQQIYPPLDPSAMSFAKSVFILSG
jgi:hypothetical protein